GGGWGGSGVGGAGEGRQEEGHGPAPAGFRGRVETVAAARVIGWSASRHRAPRAGRIRALPRLPKGGRASSRAQLSKASISTSIARTRSPSGSGLVRSLALPRKHPGHCQDASLSAQRTPFLFLKWALHLNP